MSEFESEIVDGWWDAPELLLNDRQLAVFKHRVTLGGELGDATIGAFLNPSDHRFARLIVAVQLVNEPRRLLNRSEAWLWQHGVHQEALKVIAIVARLCEKLKLVPQVLRLGNNAHSKAQNDSTWVRVGRVDEPATPHWHVLLRAAAQSDFLGVGVPMLADVPIGQEARLQSGHVLYSDAQRALVVRKLRREADLASERRTLLFVRHGETFANRQRVAQGSSRTLELARLTEDAVALARDAGARLAERYDNSDGQVRIVCSDLKRTQQTAAALLTGWPKERQPELLATNLIVERGMGKYEGTAGVFDQEWDESEFEPTETMAKRCDQFVDEFVDKWLVESGRVLIVVGHGFCGRFVLASLLKDASVTQSLPRFENLGQSRLIRRANSGKFKLIDFNCKEIW